ncbi:biosynthetic peptidoglycan transglycosylase [Pedobacter cryoconitis]|uniref:Glycosyl transferase family 51 domain-containing protein n=1 Tax=Pedobacter cryoconitis TaxID=188932 RepID=A0A7X0MMJ3_9SPHI|nr:biosynthetic peptidoglycan transglycosylase [Pedobacter cryoconitis]MBB6503030.1 hypothetical protein [Pedobacter cryoconitis]
MKRLGILLVFTKLFSCLLLGRAWHRSIKTKILNKYKLRIKLKKIKINSYKKFTIENIYIKDVKANRVHLLKSLSCCINVKSFLVGRINFTFIEANGLEIIFFKKNNSTSNLTFSPKGKGKFKSRIISKGISIFGYLPGNINFNGIKISFNDDEFFMIPFLRIENGLLHNRVSSMYNDSAYKENMLKVSNFVNTSDDSLKNHYPVSIFKGHSKIEIQFIEIVLNKKEVDSQELQLDFNFTNATIESSFISDDKLENQCINGIINFKFNDGEIIVDESSIVNLNQIPFSFFIEIELSEIDFVSIGVLLDEIEVTKVLEAFPSFMFNSSIANYLIGSISFALSLKFQLNYALNYIFDIQVSHDLKLASSDCLIDFKYLNAPFIHNILEDEQVIKTIELNKNNINFSSLDGVSEILKSTIITTEDGNFFSHKGFDKKSIGFAIVSNIAHRKFVRGASTITMQVVRNLFLNHKKTILRKFEEVIITWSLEEIYCIPKLRLFEIYLNIIEFGPNIYGIAEASEFYFSKSVKNLTLVECLIISYIIPRPKFFLDALINQSPRLLKNLKLYIDNYSQEMLRKGLIKQTEIDDIPLVIAFSKHLGTINLE